MTRPIYTDTQGRPIPRPSRESFTTDLAFIEAVHDWARSLDAVASAAVYHRKGKRIS